MEYRKMENLGVSPSLLGFGCMRFPILSNGKIEKAEAERMLDRAIAEGVNYFDTAYRYHNGKSEPFIGKVLKKYARDSFYLATKLPLWEVSKIEDAHAIFKNQLERLDMGYFDFYLLHALNKKRWDKMRELGVLDYLEKLKTEGKIKFLGFSCHDEYEGFKEILKYEKWDFCQIQLNYMDTKLQAGIKGYKLTEKIGIPLIVMEPLKGGSLVGVPEDIKKIFWEVDKKASIASWALRWVATFANVKVVLSGMSTYEQVLDNLNIFKDFKPLNEMEKKTVGRVAEALRAHFKNDCTGCGYCMPCPNEVNIPKCFRAWNDLEKYGATNQLKFEYWFDFDEGKRADKCVECGECEGVCPQNINICEDLKQVVKDLKKIKPKEIK